MLFRSIKSFQGIEINKIIENEIEGIDIVSLKHLRNSIPEQHNYEHLYNIAQPKLLDKSIGKKVIISSTPKSFKFEKIWLTENNLNHLDGSVYIAPMGSNNPKAYLFPGDVFETANKIAYDGKLLAKLIKKVFQKYIDDRKSFYYPKRNTKVLKKIFGNAKKN